MDITCYVAEHQPRAGEEIWDKITPMIQPSSRVLLLYTRFAPDSDWIKNEIRIARTFKKKFIPVKEDDIDLPPPVKGGDKEYITFDRNRFIDTLWKICDQVREYRDKIPHVFHFTVNHGATNKKLIVTPWNGVAYWTDSYVDSLVTGGQVQETEIDFACWEPLFFSQWPAMHGLYLINRPPKPHELGF